MRENFYPLHYSVEKERRTWQAGAEYGYNVEKSLHERLFGFAKHSVEEADKLVLEYIKQKGLTLADFQGNMAVQNIPVDPNGNKLTCWYKGELIFSIMQRFDSIQPFTIEAEIRVEKGDW